MIARGTPKYHLPKIPPPIPLTISPSNTIIRLQTNSSWTTGSRMTINENQSAQAMAPPWVSSRPTVKDSEELRKGVERAIRAPKAVRLVSR